MIASYRITIHDSLSYIDFYFHTNDEERFDRFMNGRIIEFSEEIIDIISNCKLNGCTITGIPSRSIDSNKK